MAGTPIVNKKQRVNTVRPQEEENHELLQPISVGVSGGPEVRAGEREDEVLERGDENKWKKWMQNTNT